MSDPIQASLLIYDIPEKAPIANPSGRLRRIAIRANLSCWIVPNHLIPYSLLNYMAENGATWHTVQFDVSEAQKLLRMANEAIKRDMEAAVARTAKSIAAAELAYEQPADDAPPPTVSDFEERTQRAIKRAKQVLGDLEEAAKVFGIDPAATPVRWAYAQAEVLRSAAHDRARRYAGAGVKAAEVGGFDGQAVANAVAADAIPAGVVADFIQDHGADDEANALRAAFAGPDAKLDDWGDEEMLSWE